MNLKLNPCGWASQHSQVLIKFLPALIVVVALALRLYGIDWDQGHLYHPDERALLMHVEEINFSSTTNLGDLLDKNKSPLNPAWFPYGSFPLYLLKLVESVVEIWTDLDVFELRIPGRILSALADTGTVIAVMALGTLLYSRKVGLLASALLAVTLIHVQISHFFTVDSFLVFFVLMSLLFMARLIKNGRLSDSAFTGLFFGLALACKASAAALLLPLVVAHLIPLCISGKEMPRITNISMREVRRAIPGLVMDGALAIGISMLIWIFMEHAYSSIPRNDALPGKGILTLTIVGFLFTSMATAHILHVLSTQGNSNLVRTILPRPIIGMTIAIATTIVFFFIAMPYAFLDWKTYLGDVGEQWLMSQRILDYPYTRQYEGTTPYFYYIQQLGVWGLGLPLGLAAIGGLVLSGWMALKKRHSGDILLLFWVLPVFILVGGQEVKFLRYLLPITPILVLMGARFLFSLKDMSLLRRYLRTSWITGLVTVIFGISALYVISYDRIYAEPHPATEASEWLREHIVHENSLLLKEHWEEGIPNLHMHRIEELPLYDPDTVYKMEMLASALSRADYLLFYSHRLYGTIPRLPERYPLTTEYYNNLFDGSLGYELEQKFTSYPNLFGVELEDSTLSRTNLPEPKYKEQENSSYLRINLGFADESFTVYDHPKVLIFKNMGQLDKNQLLSILTTPSKNKPLGLLLTNQEAELQRNGGTFSDKFHANSISNQFPVITWLLLVELVSLLILPICFMLFRGLPDRGYLLSKIVGLLLLAYFPWLLASQGLIGFGTTSIYLGLLIMSIFSFIILMIKRKEILDFLSQRWRILVFEEFLFLIAFFSFLAIRWGNPDLWHPFRGGEKPMDFAYLNAIVHSTIVPPYDPWFAGGFLNYYYFGQFIVGTMIKATGILPEIAYNLAIPLFFALTVGGSFSIVYNLTERTRENRWSNRGAIWGPALAGVTAAFLVVILGNLDGMIQLIQGAGKVFFLGESFPIFDYWQSSRMMPPDPPGHEITEFPYFTFLFSDLHAHLIAIPFALLAIGLTLNMVLSAQEKGFHWSNLTFPFLGLAIAIGALATINTWDYPTYLLIGIGAIALSYHTCNKALNARLLAITAIGGVFLASISYLFFLPFHQRYVTFSLGFGLSPTQTNLHQYLAIHGLFLFIVMSYLIYEWRTNTRRLFRNNTVHFSCILIAAFIAITSALMLTLDVLVADTLSIFKRSLTYMTIPFLSVLAISLILLAITRLKENNNESPQHLFIMGLTGGALALGIGVDIITVNNDIERMNTVFKLYLQGWVLYGLASGSILWYLLTSWNKPLHTFSVKKALWFPCLTILIISAAIYPTLGTKARLADRFSTEFQSLDGTRYMDTAVYRDHQGLITLKWDHQAIDWMRANLLGSPIVAEGHTPAYRWGSRVSVYTGLPTIIGWEWHQIQQRFDYEHEVKRRINQVERLFTTESEEEAFNILDEYNVRYIYVGQLEHLYYPEVGLEKFTRMEKERQIDIVYKNQEVTLYKVNQR